MKTLNKTWKVRLSALWMLDHLDVWDENIELPVGTFKGNLWIGNVNEDQGKEIINRCEYYADTDGFHKEAYIFCYAARRVLKALEKQAPELFH